MKVITVGIPSLLAACLLVSGAAVAADSPATTAAAAKAASTAPAPQVTPGRTTANAQSAVRGSEAGVRTLVCLNMSLRCFTVAAPPTDGSSKTVRMASLDLRAPDIRNIVSEAELRQRLDEPYELQAQQEQVEVEGTRPDIHVAPGIASLPWAVMHPTQAWRILLPVPAAK
jgi:hypothetical protein